MTGGSHTQGFFGCLHRLTLGNRDIDSYMNLALAGVNVTPCQRWVLHGISWVSPAFLLPYVPWSFSFPATSSVHKVGCASCSCYSMPVVGCIHQYLLSSCLALFYTLCLFISVSFLVYPTLSSWVTYPFSLSWFHIFSCVNINDALPTTIQYFVCI